MNFSIIVAMDEKRGIGRGGKLPWHIPAELQYFAKTTRFTKDPDAKNAVIMGRKSWDSIPDKFRPLPGRLNIVLTRQPDFAVPAEVLTATSLEDALAQAVTHRAEHVFVIGGGHVFEEALRHPDCDELLVTEVDGDFECDTFFPAIDPATFLKKATSDTNQDVGIEFRFISYGRR